ncbi:MAG: hypothetical protein HYW01_09565 [Deltaproteobacteria bacterium]|nr:hypothetical protein [Deltaproteobacteria bacterium]
MEVTSFYSELQQKSRGLEILINLIQAGHQSSSLEEVYKAALDSAIKLENVDLVMVYLVDGEKREAVLQAHRNLSEGYKVI